MHMIFSQDFGVLGIALTVFIIAFCVGMPVGVFYFAKKLSKMSQEQDRINAEHHKHHA